MSKLVITSPQLAVPLSVTLIGKGVSAGIVGGDAGTPAPSIDQTSFYACGSCASGSPTSAVVVVAAALGLRLRRRRR